MTDHSNGLIDGVYCVYNYGHIDRETFWEAVQEIGFTPAEVLESLEYVLGLCEDELQEFRQELADMRDCTVEELHY